MIFFISLLYVVMATVLSWLVYQLPGNVDPQEMLNRIASGEPLSIFIIYSNFRPLGALLAILVYLLRPIIDTGLMSYCLKIYRNHDAEYKDIFNGFVVFSKVIAIFVISAFFIFLWSLLFFFPGIAAAYRYRQAYYILLDDPRKSALQCITESKFMMYGHKLDLFIIDFSFIGWYILDIATAALTPLPLAYSVVSIWLFPYIGLTRAAFYENRLATVAV
jgi:uncharacterized membrane protein